MLFRSGVDGIITNENGEILLMHRTAGAYTGTVIPISFVAVVFSGVVAGCDVDTALTAEVTDGE